MRTPPYLVVAGLSVAFVGACGGGGGNMGGFLAGVGGRVGQAGAGGSGQTGDAAGPGDAQGTGGTGTGGMGTGGTGGAPAGDCTGLQSAGGDPRCNVNLVWKSSGCGMDKPANQGVTVPGSRMGYTEYHVQQTGATLDATDTSKAVDRQFWVRVPVDYDKDKAYRVVYIGQGCGGGNGRDNTWPLYNEAQGGTEQAIYVAVALPPNNPNGACYDNRAGINSQEWEAFELFHEVVESKYCVDNNRVYLAGYSTGGWLANMWGCYFAGIPTPPRRFAPNFRLRGQAAVTGGLPMIPTCTGPVAAIWIHDAGDNANVIAGNYAARDRVLMANGCAGSPTTAWPGLPGGICLQYTACPKEYPVIFCTTNGQGHGDQPTRAIPGFKAFFDQLNPIP